MNLTDAAAKGYAGCEANEFLETSPNWFACCLGAYFLKTGRPAPRNVRMGRGYSIRASDMRFLLCFVNKPKESTEVDFERAE